MAGGIQLFGRQELGYWAIGLLGYLGPAGPVGRELSRRRQLPELIECDTLSASNDDEDQTESSGYWVSGLCRVQLS